MRKSKSGFTLVELLIVIVVIAILAAISVVAYSGISARALDAEKATEVAAINKKIQMFYVDNGYYPCSDDVVGMNGVATLDLPLSALEAKDKMWVGIYGGAPADAGTTNYRYGTSSNADGSGFYQSSGECPSYILSYWSYVDNRAVTYYSPGHRDS